MRNAHDVPSYTVRSSNGILTCDATGRVLSCDSDDNEAGQHLQTTQRFDMIEWMRFWGRCSFDDSIDILDLGYWYTGDKGDTLYCLPESDWRKEIAQALFLRKPAA